MECTFSRMELGRKGSSPAFWAGEHPIISLSKWGNLLPIEQYFCERRIQRQPSSRVFRLHFSYDSIDDCSPRRSVNT
jgi:hypothetical protein